MSAEDVALSGGKEVDMTEYLDTWRISFDDRAMTFSRSKTKFTDFVCSRMVMDTENLEIYQVTNWKY